MQLRHEAVTFLALEELKAESEHLLGCYKNIVTYTEFSSDFQAMIHKALWVPKRSFRIGVK